MREARKIRLTNLTQTPGSLEPTLTSDKYKLVYEATQAGWFDVAARAPNNRPARPFSVHYNKVDFVEWEPEIDTVVSPAYNESGVRGWPTNESALAETKGHLIPHNNATCLTPGCTRDFKHRGRHVIKQDEAEA